MVRVTHRDRLRHLLTRPGKVEMPSQFWELPARGRFSLSEKARSWPVSP